MSQATLLRQLREERELSQAEVAAKFGVSRPTYIALEQGKRELTLSEAEKTHRILYKNVIALKRKRFLTITSGVRGIEPPHISPRSWDDIEVRTVFYTQAEIKRAK